VLSKPLADSFAVGRRQKGTRTGAGKGRGPEWETCLTRATPGTPLVRE
jgi:hypothetical protein